MYCSFVPSVLFDELAWMNIHDLISVSIQNIRESFLNKYFLTMIKCPSEWTFNSCNCVFLWPLTSVFTIHYKGFGALLRTVNKFAYKKMPFITNTFSITMGKEGIKWAMNYYYSESKLQYSSEFPCSNGFNRRIKFYLT